MDDLNFMCELHNCPFGGVCSDLLCIENNPLLCIKCAISENSCIRKFNHELITIEEFTKKYSKDLRSKFQDNDITIFELIKFIRDFKFDKVEKDYVASLNERNEIYSHSEKDLTKKIVDVQIKSNIHRIIQNIKNDLEQVKELIVYIEELEYKGFNLIPRNYKIAEKFYKIIEELNKNYPDLQLHTTNLKILFGEDQIFINKENKNDGYIINDNDNSYLHEKISKFDEMTDYQKIQNLVKLFKNIQGDPKLEYYVKENNKILEIIDNYENKVLNQESMQQNEIDKLETIISSLELLIPTLFSGMLQVLKTKEEF
jgi:hypothetical protein